MNIAQVIRDSCEAGPDIIALQEVENENVLKDLKDKFLTGMGYREAVIPESENSAVQCGLLSRYPLSELKTHSLSVCGYERNRFILEAEFTIGREKLLIFNNHWKSKSGGAEETEEQRIEAAGLIRRRIAELTEKNPEQDILILGDLNENADEYNRTEEEYQTALIPAGKDMPEEYFKKSICITFSEENACVTADRVVLFSPWGSCPGEGSYAYGSMWETIDHALCVPALFDDTGFSFSAFSVVKNDFMLSERGFPLRCNSDRLTGYSDHLPVLITLSLQ